MSDEVEMPLDLKTDITIAFDLLKNENNKINKLKLRTLLFSFVMYKYSAFDINDYIEKTYEDQELFSFNDVCDLINAKIQEAKKRESDELFNYIVNSKNESSTLKKNDLKKAFEENEIDVGDAELDKMLDYMSKNNWNSENEDQEKNKKITSVTRAQFKKFYTKTK